MVDIVGFTPSCKPKMMCVAKKCVPGAMDIAWFTATSLKSKHVHLTCPDRLNGGQVWWFYDDVNALFIPSLGAGAGGGGGGRRLKSPCPNACVP